MALFVIRHQHAAERCPAQDPYSGAMLLNHLSRPNVRRHGVQIQGEAVVHGEHTLYLIVEAADESGVPRVHATVRDGRQPGYLSGVDLCPGRRERWLRCRPACQRFSDGDGGVALYLPSDFGADVDARTGDGLIANDLDVNSDGQGDRSENRRSLRGRLGSGGKLLRIRTGDGSIRLRPS